MRLVVATQETIPQQPSWVENAPMRRLFLTYAATKCIIDFILLERAVIVEWCRLILHRTEKVLGWICGKARISVPGMVRFICLSAYAIVFPK